MSHRHTRAVVAVSSGRISARRGPPAAETSRQHLPPPPTSESDMNETRQRRVHPRRSLRRLRVHRAGSGCGTLATRPLSSDCATASTSSETSEATGWPGVVADGNLITSRTPDPPWIPGHPSRTQQLAGGAGGRVPTTSPRPRDRPRQNPLECQGRHHRLVSPYWLPKGRNNP